MRISDWSSDVCSSDLLVRRFRVQHFIVGELLLDFVQWWRLERNQRLALAAHLFDHSDDRIAVLRHQSHDGFGFDAEMFGHQARANGGNGPAVGRVSRSGFDRNVARSAEHTSELQSLMRISYAVFCLKK